MLASAAHGVGGLYGYHVAHAVHRREALYRDGRAERLLKVIVHIVGTEEVCRRQHLLALADAIGGGVLLGVLGVLVVKVRFVLVGKLKKLHEVLAVKAALAGAPVHVIVHIERKAQRQQGVAVVAVVKALAALGHFRERFIVLVVCPARGVADDGSRADSREDAEARAGGVESAVYLERGKDIREVIAAVQLAVRVYIGVEVLEQPLCRVLAVRGLGIKGKDVRHVAGHDLGVELGETGVVIVLGVIFGVINKVDAVLVVRSVEVYDGLLGAVVHIHGGHAQADLLRHGVIGHLGDGDIVKAVGLGLVVVAAGEAADRPVVGHVHERELAAVNIAAYPTEQLLRRLGLKRVAIEVDAAGVIQVVIPTTADEVVGVERHGVARAVEGSGLAVDDIEREVMAAHVHRKHADAPIAQSRDRIDIAVDRNLVCEAAVGRERGDLDAAHHKGVPGFVGHELADIEVIIRGVRFELRAAQLRAGLVEHAQIVGILALVVVVIIVAVALDIGRSVRP